MTVTQIRGIVSKHDVLSIAEDTGGMLNVFNKHTRRLYAVTPEAIDAPEEQVEAVLLGEREPTIIKVMTRTVGYYAFVENMNKSKVAEVTDRRLGDYVPGNSHIHVSASTTAAG